MTAGENRLELSDSTILAHAYLHAAATLAGVRVLSIKGPASDHHGVRRPRVSADADLLVEPLAFDKLTGMLRAAGWQERPMAAEAPSWSGHSTTLFREGWPCDLDVHRTFPGFFEDPQVVFDAFWSGRKTITLAGQSVLIPDRDATILISALHSLRSNPRFQPYPEELEELVARLGNTLTLGDRDRLYLLAEKTGCVQALDGALLRLGVKKAERNAPRDPAIDEWHRMVRAGATATHYWLRDLRGLPVSRIPKRLAYIIWPDEENLRLLKPDLPAGRVVAFRARLKRIGRGLRDLPSAVWAACRSKRVR